MVEKRNTAKIIKQAQGQREVMEKLKGLRKELKKFVVEERTIDEGHLDEKTVNKMRRKTRLQTAKTLRKMTGQGLGEENDNIQNEQFEDPGDLENGNVKKRKRGQTRSKFKSYYETKRSIKRAEETGIRLAWEQAYKFIMNNYPREKLVTEQSTEETDDEDMYLEDRNNIMEELQGNGGLDNQLRMYAV